MSTAAMLVALAGFAAVVLRVLRALLVVLRHGADAFLARDLADTRAQRGDLTGLADAAGARTRARRRMLSGMGALCLWSGLLVVPPLTPWPALLYACYSLLWLVPRRRKTAQQP